MKVYEICNVLEDIAPLLRQEEWDNCGLLIGEFGTEVTKVLVCLDVDLMILEYAAENGYNFIISHHPLIFKGVTKIVEENEVQKIIAFSILNKISIYSMHTNYDFADYSMNDHIAELLELDDIRGYADDERGFKIGRMGTVKNGISIKQLAKRVKERLKLENLSYSGDNEKIIKNILISTGSFDYDLLKPSNDDVDLIISGDIKYHAAKMLQEKGIAVIDAGHYGTEITFSPLIKKQLSNLLGDVTIDVVDFESNVFKSINE